MSNHHVLESISAPSVVDAAHEGARARMAQEALSSASSMKDRNTKINDNVNAEKQKNSTNQLKLPGLEIHDPSNPAGDSTLNPQVTPPPGTPVEFKATNPEVATPPGTPVEPKPGNSLTDKAPGADTPQTRNQPRQPNMMGG